jgi:hypothetical protein
MATHPNDHSNDTSMGNGSAGNAGGFDQIEFDADIVRVSGLSLEQQDIELDKLEKKYKPYGIKRMTIKKRLAEANAARAKEARLQGKKKREEKMREAKVGNSGAPPPLLKDALADKASTLDELIFALNTEYSFCKEGGKGTVLHQSFDPTLKRNLYTRSTREDFKAFYENRQVQIGYDSKGNPVYDELGKQWLKSPDRRQYLGGVVFLPNGDPGKEYLNLWTGFSIKPNRGCWRKMRRHIWKVICKKNKAAFRYFIQWMANVLQHPELQGYAFIVMRGEKGAGKGIVAQPFLRILGSHSLHIFNAKHLTGNFNLHLQCTVFIFIDEALYAGDRQHESILKGLVTEPTIPIEGKFMHLVESRNFLHGMMSSNADWVVPASIRERRFAVFDVSDEHANDHPYFAAIRKEMEEDGGDAAMMYDLMNLDISRFNPAEIPETEGLRNQKRLSLPLEYKWFEEVLSRGHVMDAKAEYNDDDLRRWFEDVTTHALFISYEEFVNKQRIPYSKRMGGAEFGKFMRTTLGFMPQQKVGALDGGIRGDGGSYNRITAKIDETGKRHGYHLGTLEEARARYAEMTKLTAPDTPEDDPVVKWAGWQREKQERGINDNDINDDDINFTLDFAGEWVDGEWVPDEGAMKWCEEVMKKKKK